MNYGQLAVGAAKYIGQSSVFTILDVTIQYPSERNTDLQYLIFKGLLCIGFLKRARQKTEISREQAIKDLEVSFHIPRFPEVKKYL